MSAGTNTGESALPARTRPPHAARRYRLAGAGRAEAEDRRLEILERFYDPASRRWRAFVQRGWRCLEVGAGRGSMVAWLADRVGPAGCVVATDVDVTYLRRLDLPNVEIRRHDILDDSLDRLEPGSFDVVCSRLMVHHLIDRQEEAIRRMALCVRPGGWLVDEDADWGLIGPVDPSHPRYGSFHPAWRAGGWQAERGYDPWFGRKLPALFQRAGLEGICDEAITEVIRGGSPWARWFSESHDLIARADGPMAPAQDREHEAITSALADPSVWLTRELLHMCRGRRPLSG
jgi:SAM-dependent methyltransferase